MSEPLCAAVTIEYAIHLPPIRLIHMRGHLLFIRLNNDEWITIFQTNQTESKRNRTFLQNKLNETFTTTLIVHSRSQSAHSEWKKKCVEMKLITGNRQSHRLIHADHQQRSYDGAIDHIAVELMQRKGSWIIIRISH